MSPHAQLALYCVVILAASLAGGWLPTRTRVGHRATQVLLSLVGGLMLGVAILHMLPHGVALSGSVDGTAAWMLGGLVTMFMLLRMFHFHVHEPAPGPHASLDGGPNPSCATDPAHDPLHTHAAPAGHALSWVGIWIGLSLHTLLDGVAVAASVEAEATAGGHGPVGLGAFLAVVLHKPLGAMSITTLMRLEGRSLRACMGVNAIFAAMCPLGAALFSAGLSQLPHQAAIVSAALGLSAGVFIAIALSDLLPEIEFHAHDRLTLSAALLTGVALAYAIGLVEQAGHGHDTGAGHGAHESHEQHEQHEH